MIAQLRGRLVEKHPNRVIVDVQGVGYLGHEMPVQRVARACRIQVDHVHPWGACVLEGEGPGHGIVAVDRLQRIVAH